MRDSLASLLDVLNLCGLVVAVLYILLALSVVYLWVTERIAAHFRWRRIESERRALHRDFEKSGRAVAPAGRTTHGVKP
jgi:hypothetical protein